MTGSTIYDQDGKPVRAMGRAMSPDDPRADVRESNPRPRDIQVDAPSVPVGRDRRAPASPSGITGTPRYAHAAPREGRKERRARRKARIARRPTWVGRHPKSVVGLVLLFVLTPLWISLGSAATDPALGPSVGSRLAEWVRGHGGGSIVTFAEDTWYTWNAPPKGGKPASGAIPVAPVTTSTVPVPTGPVHLAAPAAIAPFVAAPTAGEGEWHPIGRTMDGIPTMYAAYLRPNAVNTSLVTGVAWMDTKLVSATLYAGTAIPGTGQAFAHMAPISGDALNSLDAAFNSGFRMQDAQGGFYLNGVTAVPLQLGRASLVITADGTPDIGSWGTEVNMSPSVVAVRQNLDLIVDHGQPAAGLNANDNIRWGATLGGRVQVWRSGLGITADGALVYVGGSGLSIVDLANVLMRAGAVRAMEMDINTAWVNFSSWSLPVGVPATAATGTKLTYDEATYPSRYFGTQSRDFITVSVRPGVTGGPVAHAGIQGAHPR